jgi:hypothetical protein
MGKKCFSLLPSKTANKCRERIMYLDLLRNTKVRWTKEEEDILRQYYPIEGDKCFRKIPNRSYASCTQKLFELGIKGSSSQHWSNYEDDILKTHYPTKKHECFKLLAKRKTFLACYLRVKDLGLNKE